MGDATTALACVLARFTGPPHTGSPARDPNGIEPHEAVFGPLGVVSESVAMLGALCEIEETFAISIPDEDLSEELFASVASLAAYIESRLRAKPDDSCQRA